MKIKAHIITGCIADLGGTMLRCLQCSKLPWVCSLVVLYYCMKMGMWSSPHAARLVSVALTPFCVCVCTYSDASLTCYKSMYALALRLPTSWNEPYEKLLQLIRETLKSIIALQPQT